MEMDDSENQDEVLLLDVAFCDAKESDSHFALYSAGTSSAETVGAAPDL